MNSINKKRRVVNLQKEDFDVFKKHCDQETLDMPKWITKTMHEKINGMGTKFINYYYEYIDIDRVIFILETNPDRFVTVDHTIGNLIRSDNRFSPDLDDQWYLKQKNKTTISQLISIVKDDPTYVGISIRDTTNNIHITYKPFSE